MVLTLPGYVVGDLLGAGGMGAVVRATHVRSGLDVAIKVLAGGPGTDATQGQLDEEARAVAALDHPNVVRILDRGLTEDGAWLAMELATGGTLADRIAGGDAGTDWVAPLLSALAHAHARGVVHRDIKPSNILFAEDRAGRVRPLLADFGIARLARGAVQLGGTPAFMPPEAFEAGPLGPWSDLYALGAVVWTAVAGQPPHGVGTWDELAVAHRFGGLDVPAAVREQPELAAWLTRMLARDPAARPASAAQALAEFPGEALRDAPPALFPVPGDVGLGLLRLRGMPFRGRERSIAALDDALLAARVGPQVRVVVGPSGLGKTRLATEFARRCAERGTARTGVTVDGRQSAGVLGTLVADLLAYAPDGTSPAEWLARHPLARALTTPDRVDLARWLSGRAPGSVAERRDLVVRLLAATPGPWVLVFDDIQWGDDTLVLAEALATSSLPVCVVLTARSDRLDDELRARLGALGPQMEIGPLSDAAIATSLSDALPLDDGLVGHLVEQAAGSPLAAAALLVNLGPNLQAGPRGWGAQTVPSDPRPWVGALQDAAGDALPAIAVAALLGVAVERAVWRETLEALGLDVPRGVLQSLANLGLLRLGRGQLRFGHGAIREAALAGEDVDALRARVIALLAQQGSAPLALGRLLVDAGQLERAVPLLLAAAKERRRQGDYRGTLALCRERRSALAGPASDAAWGRGWLVEAEAWLRLGDVERAGRLIARCTADAAQHKWPAVAVEATLRSGMLRDREGKAAEAEGLLRDALREAEARGLSRVEGQAREHLAQVAMRRGRYDEAQAYVRDALAAYQRDGQRHGTANCLLIAGVIALKRGDAEAAKPPLEDLLVLATELGIRTNQGHAHTNLGEVARLLGDLEGAEQHYAAAAAILGRSGSLHALFPRLNRALVQVDRGRFDHALADLVAIADAFADRGRSLLEAMVRLGLLRCYAARSDWARWDASLERITELLASTEELDREAAELAEKAAAGLEGRRKTAVLSLAADHWAALGRSDDAIRTRAML